MIGVIADNSDLAFVREFFELFKTPWEFCRSGRSYSVVLSAVPEASLPKADLFIIYGSFASSLPAQSGRPVGSVQAAVLLNYRGKRFPVYRGVSAFNSTGTAIIVREDTGQSVSLEMLDGVSKTIRIGFDLFQEVRFLLSAGQPIEYAAIPTLEIHISILRDLIVGAGLPLAEIPPVPPGYDFILCLTHDVDFVSIRLHRLDRTVLGFIYRATLISLWRCMKGQLTFRKLLRNLLAVLSLPLVYAGLTHDFFNEFERYLQIEGRLKSTFFLVPYKDVNGQSPDGGDSKRRSTRYDVDDLRQEIAVLLAKGCEIGLHGIDAWHDLTKAEEEKERIQQATGMDITGVRMHWLFFSAFSPRVLEKAGFLYDSTWGYNERVGFRAGTAQVFRPPEAERLLELPLHIQDTALFSTGRMDLSPEQGMRVIEDLVGLSRETGGVLSVNWHMRSLGPERFWDGPYRHLLRLAERGRVWAAPAREVVEWFVLRRSVGFTEVDFEGRCIRLSAEKSESMPPLLLRLYNYPADSLGEVKDIPFSGSLAYFE